MVFKFIKKILNYKKNMYTSKLEALYIYPLMWKKINGVLSCKDKINTIILGSSHAEYGFQALQNEFNLGFSFQDLYYGYCLYKRYNNSNLKNIIFFYSVFSPGSQLIRTSNAEMCILLKELSSIDYQDEIIAKGKNLFKLEKKYYKACKKLKCNYQLKKDYRGNESNYVAYCSDITPEERTKPHFKNNQRNNNQTKYIEKLIKIAQQNNQNVYIVIPPATSEYKNCLPNENILFKDLYHLLENKEYKNFKIYNYYNCTYFNKDDFVDWDHLNLNGANKLTNMIRRDINES